MIVSYSCFQPQSGCNLVALAWEDMNVQSTNSINSKTSSWSLEGKSTEFLHDGAFLWNAALSVLLLTKGWYCVGSMDLSCVEVKHNSKLYSQYEKKVNILNQFAVLIISFISLKVIYDKNLFIEELP